MEFSTTPSSSETQKWAVLEKILLSSASPYIANDEKQEGGAESLGCLCPL